MPHRGESHAAPAAQRCVSVGLDARVRPVAESARARAVALLKFGGTGSSLALAVNVLVVRFWLLIVPALLYIMSKCVLHAPRPI